MGAETFFQTASGKTAREAFDNAVREALYNYGHAGYTGTIAEKQDYVVIGVPQEVSAEDYALKLVDESDGRVDDKWGPAGCINLGEGCFLFFGWASS